MLTFSFINLKDQDAYQIAGLKPMAAILTIDKPNTLDAIAKAIAEFEMITKSKFGGYVVVSVKKSQT